MSGLRRALIKHVGWKHREIQINVCGKRILPERGSGI
jgi:hypothetical protein